MRRDAWGDVLGFLFAMALLTCSAGAVVLFGSQLVTLFKTGAWPARPLGYYLPSPAHWTTWIGLQRIIGLLLRIPTPLALIIAPAIAGLVSHMFVDSCLRMLGQFGPQVRLERHRSQD